jgi:hypothetical protein
MISDPDEAVRSALAYASRGWLVFPCQPGGKAPATRHGFRDATTDPEQIRRWWERHPAANVAIATGAPGPDVLDVDQRGPAGNGFAAFNQLKRAGLIERAFAIVATPGGGLHAYFSGSSQASGSLPSRHLDFKAAGGYVLAPPSRVSGKPYRLVTGRDPASHGLDWQAAIALVDPERHRAARPSAVPAGNAGHLADWVERLPEGNRNAGLFWAACRAAEAGRGDTLDELAAAAARTGLDHREIARTIASARRAASRRTEPAAEREALR